MTAPLRVKRCTVQSHQSVKISTLIASMRCFTANQAQVLRNKMANKYTDPKPITRDYHQNI